MSMKTPDELLSEVSSILNEGAAQRDNVIDATACRYMRAIVPVVAQLYREELERKTGREAVIRGLNAAFACLLVGFVLSPHPSAAADLYLEFIERVERIFVDVEKQTRKEGQ